MQSGFYFIRLKTCLIKNRIIGKKSNCRSGLLGLSDDRKQTVLQLYDRIPSLITIFINMSVLFDCNGQKCRKCIDNGRTDTVQTAACLINGIIEFSARMKRGKYKTFRTHSFLMHTNRNTAPVIGYGCRTVFI